MRSDKLGSKKEGKLMDILISFNHACAKPDEVFMTNYE